jgi:DNA-binding NtrC family response regulator
MPRPVTVAILNTNDDVVELLRVALEQAGFVVVSAQIDAIRRGHASLQQFVADNNPRVLIYDLVPPYDRSWRFLQHTMEGPGMDGRRFIITSTNAAAARELSGAEPDVYEILGKPYDIDAIVNAVSEAIADDPSDATAS